MNSLELLGAVLASGRNTLGLSAEQAAQATSLAGNTVRRLENGDVARPRRVTLDRLAEFYGLRAPALRALANLGRIQGNELRERVEALAAAAGVESDDSDSDSGPLSLLDLASTFVRRAGEAEDASFSSWATTRHPGLRAEDIEQLRTVMEEMVALDRVRRRLAARVISEMHAAQVAER
jgi:transcriptional regulator with XRE-family HTH domain